MCVDSVTHSRSPRVLSSSRPSPGDLVGLPASPLFPGLLEEGEFQLHGRSAVGGRAPSVWVGGSIGAAAVSLRTAAEPFLIFVQD